MHPHISQVQTSQLTAVIQLSKENGDEIMLYTEINGLKLSKFTLGTVQLGMEYGVANKTGKPSMEKAHEIIGAALANGVNSLDTAAAYGNSEEVIGAYLRKTGEKPFITSKFKSYGGNAREELKASIENTVKRLGVDSVDVYMFHSAPEMMANAELLEDMLTSDERIKIPGASIYTQEEAEAFLKYPYLKAIQIPASVLDTRLISSGIIDELKNRGTIVFVRSVFLQGLLCMEELPEKYMILKDSIAEMREVAKYENMTMAELGVSFMRDVPGISTLALGCETVEQVKENASLVNCKSLSSVAYDQVMEISKRVPIEEVMLRIQGKK